MKLRFMVNGQEFKINEHSIAKDIIKFWNLQEKDFRERERLINPEFSNWIVNQKKTRILIWNGEKFSYNITRYLDKKTGKKITYHPNENIRKNGLKRYYFEQVLEAYKTHNLRRRNDNQNEAKKSMIPYDVLGYWIKSKTIDFEASLNEINIDKNQEKFCQIEMDDAYIKMSENHHKNEIMIRMLGLHTKLKNKLLVFQFNHVNQDKENAQSKLENLTKITLEIKQKIYSDLPLNLSGDGAKIITNFATKIKAQRHFDKYHFMAEVFKNLGYSKTINKINKLNYEPYIGNPFMIFRNLWKAKRYGEIGDFLEQCLEILEIAKAKKETKKSLKRLIKLWKNNQKSIIKSYENNEYFGGNAETFIGHYLKQNIKIKFANLSFETIKRRILFTIPNDVNVIFC